MKVSNHTADDIILNEIGERIVRLRLNRNMTQKALAKEAGISLPTLKRIESGGHSTNITNFIRLLRVFGLLENLGLVLPQEPVSPLQQVRSSKKVRKRASSKEKESDLSDTWSWGDDE